MLNKARQLKTAYGLFSKLLALVGQLGITIADLEALAGKAGVLVNSKTFPDGFTFQVCRKTNCARLSWQEGEKVKTLKFTLEQE